VARGRRVAVELCVKPELMAGQRHLERLTAAYLPDAAVATVGPPGELAAAAGGITVLDLQARTPPACPGPASLRPRARCCPTGPRWRG